MKFLVCKRKHLLFYILVLVVVVSLCFDYGGSVYASVFFGENVKKYPIYSVKTDEKKVAITFDAAWGADKTEQILEVLKEFKVDAPFFLVGMWCEKYESMTKLINDSGFEIGSHSYNHPDMVKLSKQQKVLELEKTNSIIEKITGKKCSLFRAPFGSYNNELIDSLSELNMTGIQWDVDTLDWKGYGPNEVIKRVTSKVGNGSIILCHNNADYVVENTRLILTTSALLKPQSICSLQNSTSFHKGSLKLGSKVISLPSALAYSTVFLVAVIEGSLVNESVPK